MRVIAGTAGALLLLLAVGLVVVVAMSMGGSEFIFLALVFSGTLGVAGVALIRRSARPDRRRT